MEKGYGKHACTNLFTYGQGYITRETVNYSEFCAESQKKRRKIPKNRSLVQVHCQLDVYLLLIIRCCQFAIKQLNQIISKHTR